MANASLFFATNRNHNGANRWAPDSYGTKVSSDGEENLRFGKLNLTVDVKKVNGFLGREVDGFVGDGIGLSGYLTSLTKNANIIAYKDETGVLKRKIEAKDNSSTKMFLDIKEKMMKTMDVVIYIHGFNVSWDEAVGGALALQFMLNRQRKEGEKEVMVVLFTWPSNGSAWAYASYMSDRTDAQRSGAAMGRAVLKLRDFLRNLHQHVQEGEEVLCGQEIHLLCHSMGNFVMQNMLARMAEWDEGAVMPKIFKHIFMCAPDVDDNVLETGYPLGRLHEIASHITLYFNDGDMAMYISDYTKGHPERLGKTGNAHPYLVHNKIHQVDCSKVVSGLVEHSYYLWGVVNDDIRDSVLDVKMDDNRRQRTRSGAHNEWVFKEK